MEWLVALLFLSKHFHQSSNAAWPEQRSFTQFALLRRNSPLTVESYLVLKTTHFLFLLGTLLKFILTVFLSFRSSYSMKKILTHWRLSAVFWLLLSIWWPRPEPVVFLIVSGLICVGRKRGVERSLVMDTYDFLVTISTLMRFVLRTPSTCNFSLPTGATPGFIIMRDVKGASALPFRPNVGIGFPFLKRKSHFWYAFQHRDSLATKECNVHRRTDAKNNLDCMTEKWTVFDLKDKKAVFDNDFFGEVEWLDGCTFGFGFTSRGGDGKGVSRWLEAKTAEYFRVRNCCVFIDKSDKALGSVRDWVPFHHLNGRQSAWGLPFFAWAGVETLGRFHTNFEKMVWE